MKDLGYNERGELVRGVDEEVSTPLEEIKEEEDGIVNTSSSNTLSKQQKKLKGLNKVGDSTLDSLDHEISIWNDSACTIFAIFVVVFNV